MNNILYNRIVQVNHSLIAGASGSGKSVLLNGCLTYLYEQIPDHFELVLIDVKKVELIDYKSTSQCYWYIDNCEDAVKGLAWTVKLIEQRYTEMQMQGLRKSNRKRLYVVVDEMADLVLTNRKTIPLLQRITQLGRACNVHLICATQCPLAKVIPTQIKVNFDCIIGLRTRTAQDSRNILGIKGCETLPKYGKCIIDVPDLMQPMVLPVPNCTGEYIADICRMHSPALRRA